MPARKRPATTALLLSALVASLACGAKNSGAPNSQPTPQTTPPQTVSAAPKSVTCALLSDEDVEAVQGERPSDSQGSEHISGTLVTSQCFYRLPTFDKSINVEVTRPAPGEKPGVVADSWRKTFGGEAVEGREREQERRESAEREREKELERERASGGTREGGHREERERDEDGSTPRRVAGVGDESFWAAGRDSAALSVLRKGVVIRVAVGGDEDEGDKLKKSKALAQKILRHF